MLCGVIGCDEKADQRTPCCREPVCDKHNKTYRLCSLKKCDLYDEEVCMVCLAYQSYLCETCHKTFCSNHNIDKYLCLCD